MKFTNTLLAFSTMLLLSQPSISSLPVWNHMGNDIHGEKYFDQSGWNVSLSSDGNVVAIGAPYNYGNGSNSGHVRVYTFDSTSSQWNQMGSDIDGEVADDQSGHSVSLSSDGNFVAIGARYNDGNVSNPGHVRVYTFDATSSQWNQMGSDIDGEAAGDQSGYSVSLSSDGNIVAIGALYNDGFGDGSGHVRVYSFDATSSQWNQIGGDIDGEAANDNSGWSVSLSSDGNIVAIGAPWNDGNGTNSGHVRVYNYDAISSQWNQMGFDIDGEAGDDQSGYSVSLSSDGNIIAIGAIFNAANGYATGHVRVYTFDSTSSQWNQMGSDIDGEAAVDTSGYSVSLSSDGNIVAIGAHQNDGNGSTSGHVRVYTFDSISSQWNQMASDIDGEAAGDVSGWSVSLSSDGNIVAIGATLNSGNGYGSGHVRMYSFDSSEKTIDGSEESSDGSEESSDGSEESSAGNIVRFKLWWCFIVVLFQ